MGGLTQHGFEVKEKRISIMKFEMTDSGWDTLCEEFGFDSSKTDFISLKVLHDECKARDENMRRLA